MKFINNDKGSSIVEFLIFAPITVMIMLYVHSVHTHMESSLGGQILSRNLLMLGNKGKEINENYLDIVRGKMVSNLDRSLYESTPENVVRYKKDLVFGDGIIGKITANTIDTTDIKTEETTLLFGKTATDHGDKGSESAIDVNSLAINPIFTNHLKMDQVIFSTPLDEDKNGIQKSISFLKDYNRQGKDEYINQQIDIYNNLYLSGNSGYHSNDANSTSILTTQASVGEDIWGDDQGGDFSRTVFFEDYCLNNSTGIGSCGNVEFVYLSIILNDFTRKVFEVASAKINLENVLDPVELTTANSYIKAQTETALTNIGSTFLTDYEADFMSKVALEGVEDPIAALNFETDTDTTFDRATGWIEPLAGKLNFEIE
ncbi:MAG: hypothetical protein KC493_01610 [Bacteriovoracaceae bacterium]|nr:hypothetical protein [Bacteriovoracaceae bacterium]